MAREKACPQKKKSSDRKKPSIDVPVMDENFFRTIFDNSPIGIELFDSNGFLINANKSGLANYGVSDIAELKNFSFFDDPMFPEGLKKELRKGNTARFDADFDFDKARELGLFNTQRTGTISFDMLFTPIVRKKGGPVSAYIVQVQDITGRKKSEEALRKAYDELELLVQERTDELLKSKRQFREIFQSASDAFWLWGLDQNGMPNRLIDVNNRATEMLGYRKEELLTMTPGDFVSAEFRPRMAPIVKQIQAKGHATYEMTHIKKDGTEIPVEVSSHTFALGSEKVTLSVVRDITERKKSEEALQESNEELERRVEERTSELTDSKLRYRKLFNSGEDYVLVHGYTGDLPGNFIEVNDKACEVLGYTREEFMSLTPFDIDSAESFTDAPAIIKQLLETGQALFEQVHVARDGRKIPVEIHSHIIDLGGERNAISICRDMRTRMETERQLRESETRFRSAFENMAVGASLAGLKGQFIKVNSALCRMLGYEENELLSMTYSDVTHPEDVQIGLDAARKMVAGEIDYAMFEKRYVRKDGQLINVVISPCVIRDGDGKPLHFLALFQDITERKKAEEALRESEQAYRTLFRVANDMILVADLKSGVILDANQKAEEVLGIPLDKIIGMNREQLHPEQEASRSTRAFKKEPPGGGIVTSDLLMKRGDGRVIPLEVSATVTHLKGRKIRLGIFRDITERKKAEKQKEDSLREKEVLLKEIHHRVKNNMAIVSSMLRLQSRYSDDSNIRRILEDSQNRINSMAMVHEKLYESQDFSNVRLKGYVEKLAGHLVETYSDENIRVEHNIDEIELDIDRIIPLGLILNELLTNSIKHAFSDVESPEIGIHISSRDGVTGLVYHDNGRGLPEDVDLNNAQSLGLKIIGMLSYQLRGDISLDGTDRSRYNLNFPVRKDA